MATSREPEPQQQLEAVLSLAQRFLVKGMVSAETRGLQGLADDLMMIHQEVSRCMIGLMENPKSLRPARVPRAYPWDTTCHDRPASA